VAKDLDNLNTIISLRILSTLRSNKNNTSASSSQQYGKMLNILIDNEALNTTNNFLADLFARRGSKVARTGYSARIVELNGGTVIEPTAFEPEALTHRSEYYYNATNNTLYRRIRLTDALGNVTAYWTKVSE